VGDITGKRVDEQRIVPIRATELRRRREKGGSRWLGSFVGSYREGDTAGDRACRFGPSRERGGEVVGRPTVRRRHAQIQELLLDVGRSRDELTEGRLDPEAAEGDGVGPYVVQPPEQ
jgi:hypothetical protein